MKYSPSTGGFYLAAIHGNNIPADAVRISDEVHAELMDAQSNGFEIRPDANGLPTAMQPQQANSTPQQCTPAQGLIALFALKRITETDVLTAIGNISDDDQRYTALIGYQRATVWDRASPTMQAMAQLLQLSEEELDALYSYAVTVQV